MNDKTDLPWDAIRLFLAIARAGSLTGAAARTGLSQPTLGRRLDDLEARLGATLFVRGRGGMTPTETGRRLEARAAAMEEAAGAFARLATGARTAPEGDVRVTASRVVATHLLPPILAALGRSDPGIRVDLVATDEVSNLLARDADVAVRMVRPAQADLVARRVGDLALGAFAAPAYLEAHGRPGPTSDELLAHRLVGYDRATLLIDGMRAVGVTARREDFAVRADDQVAYLRLVVAGAGIGFVPRVLAEAEGLAEVPLPGAAPALPVWLAAHRDVRTNPAVRRVTDALAEGLARALASEGGAEG